MSGRILVVDDIATNRVILRAKLAAAYYEVTQADNGATALERAAADLPDLILLDVMMPDMNGYDVCLKLKTDPKTAHIPVIMVTSLFETSDRLRGLECGADDFISKPISDLALFARVRNLLRAKFMQDELRLRDSTTQDLGLSPPVYLPGHKIDRPGKVVLLPSNAKAGRDWAQSLARHSGFDCRIALNEDQVKDLDRADMPDVFVIHSQLDRFSDGLRLVSHLRSSPKSRQVAIILVVPEGDQQKAAKGLDLGASDYIFDPFDPMELIVRLKSQIHRKQISDKLRENVTDTLRLAVLDPLTGLYNRRYAQQHLEKISQRTRETGKEFALMLLDIDNFKRVNDTYGHAGGDTVLAELARRIQENLRGVDLISRLGGEEFLVAMPDTSESQARIASERLRHVIESSPFSCDSIPDGVDITVSIGVTLGTSQAPDVKKLVQQADQALYSSKSDGRNMVTLFNSAA